MGQKDVVDDVGDASAEVCKILLGEGELLRNRKLVINLLDMGFEIVSF